ncbi:MAG: hypothetical protein CMB72_01400 [Euryarchaeota archaeon]|nr:hypothetical protein [Euryarchaeota archaeon]
MVAQSEDFSQIISNIYSNKEANRYILVSLIATIIMFSYTGYDLLVVRSDAVNEFTEMKEWSITFDIQNETRQEIRTLQDDETQNILFDLNELTIPDGYSIGLIDITITSEENEGLSVQCDSVAGDIIKNELTAQWDDPSNNLSGQDSSCQPIYLDLKVYPNYDGNAMSIYSINEYQALINWTEQGWGEGELSIDLDLDVNSPAGFDPVGLDDDEEIVVDVYIEMFKAQIMLVE